MQESMHLRTQTLPSQCQDDMQGEENDDHHTNTSMSLGQALPVAELQAMSPTLTEERGRIDNENEKTYGYIQLGERLLGVPGTPCTSCSTAQHCAYGGEPIWFHTPVRILGCGTCWHWASPSNLAALVLATCK
jgi:hypothetical protein